MGKEEEEEYLKKLKDEDGKKKEDTVRIPIPESGEDDQPILTVSSFFFFPFPPSPLPHFKPRLQHK